MKRTLTWAIGVFAVVGIVAALIPWTFSGEAIRTQIALQVKDATGLSLQARGRAVIAFLPRPRIKLYDVKIDDPTGALSIETEELRGNLRLLPMFGGKLELSNLALVVPTMYVNLAGKPFGSKGAIAGALGSAVDPADGKASNNHPLGIISIESGLARVEGLAGRGESLVSDINMTLDWRKLAAPAALSASFKWRTETADIAAWVENPQALLGGGASKMTLKIDSPPLSLSLDGNLAGGAAMEFDGRFDAASPSLRNLARMLAVDLPLPSSFADTAVTGTARITPKNFALSDLQAIVDGNKFDGTLAVATGGPRPVVSGTLAADFLTAAPLVGALPPLQQADGDWNRRALEARDLHFADLDLRISASHARFAHYDFQDAGLAVLLNDGNLELSLAEAKAYGGTVKGKINVVPSTAGLDVKASGSFTNVDAGALLTDGTGAARITGIATGSFDGSGSGDSVATLFHTLSGNGQVTLNRGEIIGIDLEQALRRVEKRPLSIAAEVRSGRTGFDNATATVRVANGVAQVSQAMVSGPGIQLALNGEVRIADRRLDLHALARQAGTDMQPRIDGPQLHLDIKGAWESMSLGLDADSLIRSSEAAAPLYQSATSAEAAAAAMRSETSRAPAAPPVPAR